ncbi:MAG TPA: hypothetical protein VLB83_03590 [Candidatus Paceibacterota bacterium]|nr:hypothetical protein [Candidatus Paceibacterota bacterium]
MTGKMWLWVVYLLQLAGVIFGFIPWIIGIVIWMVQGGDMENAIYGISHRRWQNLIFWIAFGGMIATMLLMSVGVGVVAQTILVVVLLVCIVYGMFCLSVTRPPMRV